MQNENRFNPVVKMKLFKWCGQKMQNEIRFNALFKMFIFKL